MTSESDRKLFINHEHGGMRRGEIPTWGVYAKGGRWCEQWVSPLITIWESPT